MVSTEQLFRLLKKPEVGSTFSAEQWQNVIWILREAKLLSSLYHMAIRAQCYDDYPVFAQRHLYSAQVYARRQAQQIEFEAKGIRDLLEQVSVKAIFLKGAGYTLRDSLNSKGRICSDLDILVAKDQLSIAEKHLQANRWKPETLSDYDEQYYRKWAHEIPPMIHLNRGTVIDVHHNVYLPISGRSPNIEAFLTRTCKTASGCFVLQPVPTVLHCIIHLFTNEDSSSWMRDLFDISVLLDEFESEAFYAELQTLVVESGFETEWLYCIACLKHYEDRVFPNVVNQFLAQHPFTRKQKWLCENAIIPAIAPNHSMVCQTQHKLAKNLVYFRGHWMKMPLHILIKHFVLKSFFSIRDQVMGKYHFEPKLPNNPNW